MPHKRHTYVVTWHVYRDVRVAYQEYELHVRNYGVPATAYLPRCFRMYDVCVTYVRRIGPVTFVLRIFKCTHKKRSTSAYELRIDEYELRMLTNVRRTRDVPFCILIRRRNVSRYAIV